MTTLPKSRIILILVYLLLTLIALPIPLLFFDLTTTVRIAQITIGALTVLFHLINYRLVITSPSTPQQVTAGKMVLVMSVGMGLTFVLLGIAGLTESLVLFAPACLSMSIGIIGAAVIWLRSAPRSQIKLKPIPVRINSMLVVWLSVGVGMMALLCVIAYLVLLLVLNGHMVLVE